MLRSVYVHVYHSAESEGSQLDVLVFGAIRIREWKNIDRHRPIVKATKLQKGEEILKK